MSLKPIKRSDHNKMWMQPRRDRHKLIQPEYHLIVTEGTKTEPSYFKAMSTIINHNYPASHIDETERLCKIESNNEITYHAIWSNQCVKLWFLLHFNFIQSDLNRNEYWPKLTQILKSLKKGEYHKNRDDMYHILYPYMNTAIINAKKLETINEEKKPSNSAPGTMIHKLIEKLKPYLTSNN